MVARTLTATQIAALTLPTVQQMATVAAQIPQVHRGTWQRWDARPASFLEVAPGMVRFTRSAAHLKDAAADRTLKRRWDDSAYLLRAESTLYGSPMALLTDGEIRAVDGPPSPLIAGKRITAWSRKSRSRMKQQLSRFDYSKLFEDRLAPAMITLTMPGVGDDGDERYWESLAPTPASFKAILNRWTVAYSHAWGSRPVGLWKMEFQERGAPHLHMLLTPPAGSSAGKDDGLDFKHWLGRSWARAVGSTGQARIAHEQRGTGIDYVEEGYRDPRRIAGYFEKHGAMAYKEYQNQMPDIWLDAIHDGATGARFWGSWGLPKASAVLQLDDRGAASAEVLIDPLGLAKVGAAIARIISDDVAEAEERQRYSTPSTVLRAYQRSVDDEGSASADDVLVQRYMRKLSRSLAHRGVQHVRNRYGQLVLPGAVRDGDGRPLRETVTSVIGVDGQRHRTTSTEVAGHRIPTRRPGAPRKVAYDATDPLTGEIRRLCRYRVGFYQGGAGYLLVNDGRVTGRNIARVLGATWDLAA